MPRHEEAKLYVRVCRLPDTPQLAQQQCQLTSVAFASLDIDGPAVKPRWCVSVLASDELAPSGSICQHCRPLVLRWIAGASRSATRAKRRGGVGVRHNRNADAAHHTHATSVRIADVLLHAGAPPNCCCQVKAPIRTPEFCGCWFQFYVGGAVDRHDNLGGKRPRQRLA